MKFIGVDLHKKTISLCVIMVVEGKRGVVTRRRFNCRDTARIRKFFEQQGDFQVVVEATANYEWFLLLIEVPFGIVDCFVCAGVWLICMVHRRDMEERDRHAGLGF